jgi:hypothetical protein
MMVMQQKTIAEKLAESGTKPAVPPGASPPVRE